MRLWFQLLSSPARLKDFQTAMQAQCDRAASPGTTVEIHGTQTGGLGDEYQLFSHLDTNEVFRNALRIRQEGGYDAFVLANAFDPGLVGLREILDIPVLSLMEVACFGACMMGETFGLIVPREKLIPCFREIVAGYGLGDRLVAVDAFRFKQLADMNRMFTDQAVLATAVEEFTEAARRTIAAGAEVLFAPGPPMTAMAMAGVHRIDGALVLDGFSLLVKVSEAMVSLHRLTGVNPVSRLRRYGSPSQDLLRRAAEVYGIPELKNG